MGEPITTGLAISAGASLVGGLFQQDAGKRMANAQQDIANAQLEQQRADRAAAVQAAEPSAMELEQLQRAITLNEQDIARKQRLLDSADPALIESGKQALALLQGQEAKVLSPLRAQQAKDRAKLEEQLRARLGSGYAETSTGMQALAAFDEASQNAQFNAQQQSLAQLLGIAQDTSGRYGIQSNAQVAAGLSGQRGNINARRVSAINGTPITGAGAQYVGGLQGARNDMSFIGNMAGTVGQAGTLYAMLGSQGIGSPTGKKNANTPWNNSWAPQAGEGQYTPAMNTDPFGSNS